MNVCVLHLARDLRQGKQRVSTFYHVQQLLHEKNVFSFSWERNVFLAPCAVLGSLPATGVPVLSWSGFGFGWFDWELLNCWTTCPACGRSATSEPISFLHSSSNEIFGRDDVTHKLSHFLPSPISILTFFGIQQAGSVSWRNIAFDRVW